MPRCRHWSAFYFLAGLVPWLGQWGWGSGVQAVVVVEVVIAGWWVEILVGVGQGWDGERGAWFYVPR